MSNIYRIKVHGCLAFKFSKWLNDMHIKHLKEEETIIEGSVEDQAALFGVLIKIRDLGLPLLSLEKIEEMNNEDKKV